MDVMAHLADEEREERSYYGGGGERGTRWLKTRSNQHQQLLLMDCVVGDSAAEGGASKEVLTTLPEYERLSQSARLSDEPEPKKPPSSPAPASQETKLTAKQGSTSPLRPQQKPAAWRLIEYVRSRNKSAPAAGCSSASDGDSKSSDGEKEEGDDGKTDKKKKRSSWLPDPDRRWPVQGFY